MEKFNSKKPDQNDNMQREPGEISGFSDEEILREFEEAMKSTIPLPPPPENEFNQICQRIEKENEMKRAAKDSRFKGVCSVTDGIGIDGSV